MKNLQQKQIYVNFADSRNQQDEEFSWEEYMEETNTEGVPAPAFLHIEKSLESQVFVNQLLEVECQKDDGHLQYWVARVVNICGPLLRLGFISPTDINVHCWREVFSGGLYPIGHCASREIPLDPPLDLAKQLNSPETIESAIECVKIAIKNGKSVIAEALTENGFTHSQCIKTGMKLEVLNEQKAYCGWVATVQKNCGGRLLLCYDTPESSGAFLWKFYQHHTLRPLRWIEKQGPPWRYFPPESNGKHNEIEWENVLKRSKEQYLDEFSSSVLCDSVEFFSTSISTNLLVSGMLMEAVNFADPRTIHIAAVKEILDQKHIKIVLKTNSDSIKDEMCLITTLSDPLLFPKGFCKNNNIPLCPPSDWLGEGDFDWDKYLQSSPEFSVIPELLFPKHETAEELGFEAGMRLEATNPVCRRDIGAATIEKTFGHILMVRLDSTVEKVQILTHARSQELFPTGWCQTNKYPLRLPPDYCPKPRPQEQISSSVSEKINENSYSQNSDSRWCPRIYVNHWCYSGPYLSKSKVAKQSQSVGPGSVELVLREVLAMAINAAYVPTRVLRELERHNGFNGPNVHPSWRNTTLKSKFKRYSYSATVPVATLASDMSDYLSGICQTLQCCPNLWSTTQTGEACPLICYAQVQAVGSNVGNSSTSTGRSRGRPPLHRGSGGRWGNSTSRTIHRRKRGGRKRLFVPIRAPKPHHHKLLAEPYDLGENMDDDYEDDLEGEDPEIAEAMFGSDDGGDTTAPSSRATSPSCGIMGSGKRKKRGFSRDFGASLKRRFDSDQLSSQGHDGSHQNGAVGSTQGSGGGSTGSGRGLEPADVQSDPLLWTVDDVEHYVVSQPAISHHAPKLKDQQVDGRAFLLLNLPTLIHHLSLPRCSAVSLAQHVCRVKLAHFMYYYPQPQMQQTTLPSQVF